LITIKFEEKEQKHTKKGKIDSSRQKKRNVIFSSGRKISYLKIGFITI
jgi:hypothetical protein